jgi:DNA-binding MarR family transcriptional regulator
MQNNQFKRGELYSFITGKASTAIARRLQQNFKNSGIDITVEQWSVLYHLWKEEGQSQQQLCDATFRDKPGVTRLVDNLEKLKLVKRVQSKSDRRINLIYLTREAKQLQEETMRLANKTLNEALNGVTTVQVETAKQVLQIVYDNLSVLLTGQ